MHQIRFRTGLRPDPTGEADRAPPDPLGALRGPTSKEKRKEGREKGRKEGERKGMGGTAPPPFANLLIIPWSWMREEWYVASGADSVGHGGAP